MIHKENGGLSDARNAGMKVMAGVYVSYIDSDDWIAQDMYQKMINAIKKNNADICECAFERTSGIEKKKIKNVVIKINYGYAKCFDGSCRGKNTASCME